MGFSGNDLEKELDFWFVVVGSLTATALGVATLCWSETWPKRSWLAGLGYVLLFVALGLLLFLQLFQPLSTYGGLVVPSTWLVIVAITVLGLVAVKTSGTTSARSWLRGLGYILLWAALSFFLFVQLLRPIFLYALLVAPSYSLALLGIGRYLAVWRAERDKERMRQWLR